jgi:hypothetical protein
VEFPLTPPLSPHLGRGKRVRDPSNGVLDYSDSFTIIYVK